MSAFTSSMVCSWSGVSAKGNASSSSRCHGVSGPKAWPRRRHARRVELDQLDGDVAHGLAGLALRGRPVAAAHLRQRRRLAADVAGEQVELVGRHEEPVAGLAALGGRVLEHEVLAHDGRLLGDAGGAARPRRACPEATVRWVMLDEAADAVRLVHDVVARLQLQRVDDVLAAARELLELARVVAGGAAVELAPRRARRASPSAPRSRATTPACTQVGDTGLRIGGELVDDARGEAALGEHLARTLDETVPGGDDGHRPAVGEPRADVLQRRRRRCRRSSARRLRPTRM